MRKAQRRARRATLVITVLSAQAHRSLAQVSYQVYLGHSRNAHLKTSSNLA